MKTYVLYHANCMDGFGAALCAWLKYGDEAEYIPVSHGQPLPPMDNGSVVYILDFSYKVAELLALRDRMTDVVVLDHHATAKTELESIPWATFDMTKSGARMAWEHFFGNQPVPMLIRYIEDRDLWKWSLPQSKEVNAALGSYEMTFPVWNSLLNHTYSSRWIEEGTAILRMVDKNVKRQCENVRFVEITPNRLAIDFVHQHPGRFQPDDGLYPAPVVNATCHVSEIGHELLQQFPDAPFVAVYLDKADGTRMWSLRSRADFDCSVIARAFGGGGHKQACGFTQHVNL